MPANRTSSTTTPGSSRNAAERGTRTRNFDFRRPNKLNRDQLRSLQIIHETFSGQFSTMLSSSLRSVCVLSVETIEELTYDEYVRDIDIPTYMSILSLEPLKGAGILHLQVDGAMTIVEMLLGGSGGGALPVRPLSEIESSVVRLITDRGLKELAYAFETVTEINPAVIAVESNPQFVQLASPGDMVVVVSFRLRIADVIETEVSLCYPYGTIQPLLEKMDGQSSLRNGDAEAAAATAEKLAGRITEVPVDVSVVFEPTSMRSREILALRTGDILTLEHPAGALLTANVDGVPLFTVRPARKGKRVAAQVVDTAR
ncbi:MAG: flagellar motor switch protein FliM [Microthrixaceae bacterium]